MSGITRTDIWSEPVRTLDQIIIREYQEEDEQQINSLHNEQYGKNRNNDEWIWEFRQGPWGEAIIVVAEYNGRIIGTQALLPEYLSWKGQQILTAKSEETLIAKEFRGQGVFDKLYEKCFELATRKGISLIWGFTNALKPFRKIGFITPGSVDYCILILNASQTYELNKNRIPPKLKKRLHFQTIPLIILRIFTIVGYLRGLSMRIMKRHPSDFQVIPVDQADDKLETLGNSFLQDTDILSLARTAQYLNWRVFRNPHLHSQVLAAIRNGEIKGYVILSKSKHQNVGSITDFCVREDHFNDTVQVLMSSAVEYFRSQRVAYVDAWYAKSNRYAENYLNSLRKFGFLTIPGGSGIVIRTLANKTELPVDPNDLEHWYITLLFSEGVG